MFRFLYRENAGGKPDDSRESGGALLSHGNFFESDPIEVNKEEEQLDPLTTANDEVDPDNWTEEEEVSGAEDSVDNLANAELGIESKHRADDNLDSEASVRENLVEERRRFQARQDLPTPPGEGPGRRQVEKGYRRCDAHPAMAGHRDFEEAGLLDAAAQGHEACVIGLYDAGADIDGSSPDKSPISVAAREGHRWVVQELVAVRHRSFNPLCFENEVFG